MKRVASTRALQQTREKVLGLKFGKALTDVGPWAVVVAEGLEIFWAFRKGEGCLAGTRPDTAAIIGGREEGGDRYRWMKKNGGRSYRREEGGVSGKWIKGGLVTYREER